MGQSTDAILFYGILFEEEGEPPAFIADAGFDYFDDYVESQSGLPLYGQEGHSFDDHRAYKESLPVEMIHHCSSEYEMYGLAVKGCSFLAKRGYPVTLDNGLPEVSDGKRQAFLKWLSDRGIAYDDPKWILCSYWG